MSKMLSIAAAILVWFACLTSVAATPEKPKVVIAVGGKASLYYLPLTIADRKSVV